MQYRLVAQLCSCSGPERWCWGRALEVAGSPWLWRLLPAVCQSPEQEAWPRALRAAATAWLSRAPLVSMQQGARWEIAPREPSVGPLAYSGDGHDVPSWHSRNELTSCGRTPRLSHPPSQLASTLTFVKLVKSVSLLSGCRNVQETIPTLREVSVLGESSSMACGESSGGVCRAQDKASCMGRGARPQAEQLLATRLGACHVSPYSACSQAQPPSQVTAKETEAGRTALALSVIQLTERSPPCGVVGTWGFTLSWVRVSP